MSDLAWANRLFAELYEHGLYAPPAGASLADPRVRWSLTEAGSKLLAEIDKVLGYANETVVRADEAVRVFREHPRAELIARARRAEGFPPELSDDGASFLLTQTQDVLESLMLRHETTERIGRGR